jgi:hypothetical protein
MSRFVFCRKNDSIAEDNFDISHHRFSLTEDGIRLVFAPSKNGPKRHQKECCKFWRARVDCSAFNNSVKGSPGLRGLPVPSH